MPKISPFQGIRPAKELASKVAALPYDVYNRQEAKAIVEINPYSFLRIDRAETQFPDSVGTYDSCVYEKAKELLADFITQGIFITDDSPCYYLYELTMDGRSQTGIVACSEIDDYLNGKIKKHENTREDKEIDRICHVDTTNAQTGPIFLVYRKNDFLHSLTQKVKKEEVLYDFTGEDQVTHRVWKISDSDTIHEISTAFELIPCTYIADGHHRCASAVKVGQKRRKLHPEYTGQEEFNRFLSVLFPEDELEILPYNRVVKDLNGYSAKEFIQKIANSGFSVSPESKPISPKEKGSFGMYLDGQWYLLTASAHLLSNDPVEGLDVSLLQKHLLSPILGIGDPRVDKRIDFVGGIRGLSELEKRVHEDMTVAFSMYPTSITELLNVADAGLLMPPKSTWFEPKLRSGLFIHKLN